ncbi:unnamed protein product [Durusdinium trenchii]|uniref:Uncharacterized protein n=2 Tax=Durusdinium trenchii TaxID=1381693 RepID=A0ABP0SR48_9DINO
MGQICQRRAAPEVAAPKVTLVPKKHDPKRYGSDYSRFDHIEDSDEEVDTKVEEEVPYPEEPEPQNPSDEQRKELKEKFMKISRKMVRDTSGRFRDEEKPKAARLPKDHQRPVGTISLQELAKYSCSNDRMLLSCYGDIFDVSSRPDLYGWGPKSWQSGKDITWSAVTGNEKPDQCNRFYDVFKLDPDRISRYLTLICNRLVALQDEFGKPVGRLDRFLNERHLPAAPQSEVEECKQQ